ncbi:phospho-N-acetylmuramoyl-pentapeptide-transferase [Acetatifactor muris]|uniref:Phospho-N-acetylmuramoyl-pentapeptide-transferase n=1 Tax=Acetatifactor muris TaxID=879566 RepID=A0A2K4ZND8_9FIRM|nr:phospho-N-acetylmuramoyl-pentapeptide-transferase [Acetatifactor muris]MCI8799825.1 phospho-N-acetylmuramoyl-pentapeptide-transferase [Lachnospiraceae bacterium]MCR2050254.1 phospho-N-acetylmuramoyl-pentapeptide-transferase [Acetatifactor muris]SOY31912.1 Phospho-N-acetylmuramoyl-pentapeptide-transferase [Acetatifactor muris]
MSKISITAVMISFCISALSGPILIPFLRWLKCGQTVRDDGPAAHLKKSGTPTMGGILILASVAATSVIFAEDYPRIAPVLFLTVGFGLIGLMDDYIKVVCRRSLGLTAWQKLLGQLSVTGIFAWYLIRYTDVSLAMKIPCFPGRYLDFGVWNIPILFFIVLGTANGTNFTDGLDGLAGSVTLMVAVFFSVVALGTASGIEPVTCAAAGALLGFLLFNVHPAQVFMGDTGSLALGGFVAGCAYMMQMPLYIAIVGVIYLAEVFSVILQVSFYKVSGGRRLFKMAPLHHHFELCGWSETRITALFTIITALMCLAALNML